MLPSALRTSTEIPSKPTVTTVVAASLVGTSLEWYDHFIYGSAAALVFPKLFFPQEHPATALLLSLASYGVAFVARPLGAAIFGHYGDILGRKRMLAITILTMGIATFLIGLLPTYPSIGVAAPATLVLLRLVQGLALGGEWGGAVLLVNEYDPKGEHRGFLGSLVQVASPLGLLAANAVFALVTFLLAPDAVLAWGWRIPFLLSVILVIVGYVIRRNLPETTLFKQVELTRSASRVPLAEVFHASTVQVLRGIGSRIGSDIVFYVFTLFLLVYLPRRLDMPGTIALSAVLAAAVAQMVGIPLFGALSDRVGRRIVLIGGAAATMVWGFVFFLLVDTKSPGLIVLASFVGMFLHAAMWGPLASFLPEMFETRVRYTGASLSFQLAGILGNAPAPLIATQFMLIFTSPWPLAFYLAAFLLLAMVSVAMSPETVHIDLSAVGSGSRYDERADCTRRE